MMNHKNKSVNVHQFAMIPRAEIPRSSFNMEKAYKTTFDSGWLVPFFCEEVLPGDTFNTRVTAFARLATPLFPVMDNMYLETFFFFVPNRLVWDNWQKFMGEQVDPGDSIDYLVPNVVMTNDTYVPNDIYDYFGLPVGQPFEPGDSIGVNSLPFRAYNLIWNQWFRDENLQDSVDVPRDDGPDSLTDFAILRRGKRKDYFTGCLPWAQKGQPVTMSLGGTAPVDLSELSINGDLATNGGVPRFSASDNVTRNFLGDNGSSGFSPAGFSGSPELTGSEAMKWQNPALIIGGSAVADLSDATAFTINAIRTAFQVQKLLERDARGGTRYTEIIRAHFGVVSPDARLQRPEYLGGGQTPVNINPIAQTSATGIDGGTSPTGSLSAMGTALARNHGFSQSFTEHGYVIGLCNVRADLTYQNGLRKMWSRRTRYDFYFPVFAALGEQAVLNKEIFVSGDPTVDDAVFGYQERWAEYRYSPSQITGYFRSNAPTTLDAWHLAQNFSTVPALNAAFIVDNPPIDRIVAVEEEANGKQFLMDMFIQTRAARPMPMYSVPGLVDHF